VVQVNSGMLETQGVTIYFETHGDVSRTPLFVLHGGPGLEHSYFLASPVWHDLATRRQVVLYDQRGTGKSSPLEADDSCTLADQLADLEALREHLEYECIDLLGHSWGGYLAMAYTVRRADRVRRLVLLDSCPPRLQDAMFRFAEFFPETWERYQALDTAAQLGDQEARQELLSLHMYMMCRSPEDREAWLAAIGPPLFWDDVYQKLWSDAENHDLTAALTRVELPVLVTTGRFDVVVQPAAAEFLSGA